MEILWERNETTQEKSDRQLAYERGHDFVKMTANAVKKANAEEKAAWQKISDLVANYGESADTEKIIEE